MIHVTKTGVTKKIWGKLLDSSFPKCKSCQNFISDIRSKIRDLEREPCSALRNVLGRYLQIILERALTRLQQLRAEEDRVH